MNSRLASVNHRTDALGQRHLGEQPLHRRRERHVELGHDPDRRALVDGQLGDFLRQLRNDLHTGGAGSDDGGPATGERIAVIPRGGVDDPSGKRVDPLDVRDLRLAQEAGRGDQELRAQRLTAGERHPPEPGRRRPTGRLRRWC